MDARACFVSRALPAPIRSSVSRGTRRIIALGSGKENHLRTHRTAAACARFLLHRPFLAPVWRVCRLPTAPPRKKAMWGLPTSPARTWDLQCVLRFTRAQSVPKNVALKYEKLTHETMQYTSITVTPRVL
jgi:hypothetical protein